MKITWRCLSRSRSSVACKRHINPTKDLCMQKYRRYQLDSDFSFLSLRLMFMNLGENMIEKKLGFMVD
ncbi:Melibiase family protein [Trifolium repens]|nr:Melibiase family protein [Trifolium repens]